MLWIIKLFFIIKRRKVTYIMGRELMGLASCDDDRKAIINFTIVAAKYFNDQVTALNTSLTTSAVFPAHAGVILEDIVDMVRYSSISRTCGGDPPSHSSCQFLSKYFPHMRG